MIFGLGGHPNCIGIAERALFKLLIVVFSAPTQKRGEDTGLGTWNNYVGRVKVGAVIPLASGACTFHICLEFVVAVFDAVPLAVIIMVVFLSAVFVAHTADFAKLVVLHQVPGRRSLFTLEVTVALERAVPKGHAHAPE
eukprot:Gregarina_sp_Pseudo_9__518@NODE_1331_length_1683_cov_3251_594282_g560_i2_p2_GENE_NODE_1331_length_1683_cov_3251_594282_g560_i2NODE_1331_length_1683_cov_3251_594282_g560_i2_p2_ORF_typecomplete_len139_score1_72_NODE_1331_length_1683_cov_3251_594282_g560_i295511